MSHDFSRISQHLDFVSKSLKTFIWFFIGTPNASTWCSISRCWLVGMKYELLLMHLRSLYSRFRLHNFSLSPKCKWVALWSNMTNKLTTCNWPRLFFVDWESPPLYYDNLMASFPWLYLAYVNNDGHIPLRIQYILYKIQNAWIFRPLSSGVDPDFGIFRQLQAVNRRLVCTLLLSYLSILCDAVTWWSHSIYTNSLVLWCCY